MPHYHSLRLNLGKTLAQLVLLRLPHARNGCGPRRPKAINQAIVMGEVLFKHGPLVSNLFCILHFWIPALGGH